MTYMDAKDKRPKTWNFVDLFICVFHRIQPGNTASARSVTIVVLVATWPMATNVAGEPQVPSPLKRSAGVQRASVG